MTQIMLNCGGKLILAASMNQMEEEIMNLALYNLWLIKILLNFFFKHSYYSIDIL